MAGIFLIDNKSNLTELKETPYDSENLLQELIAKYPDLLAGDLINHDDPRRWLLITREAGIPAEVDSADRWSVDHLFLDQDGIPTLIEVKRSEDTRIRREVAGQMLDYAANAVLYWPVDKIEYMLEKRCEKENLNPEELLQNVINDENVSTEEYWIKVKDNLKAGKIRMIFVSDEIPTELQRIVEFLNSQMDPAEVLAIEIKQFTGHEIKTLVPRIYGYNVNKNIYKGKRETKIWDEQSILLETEERLGSNGLEVMNKIFEWGKSRGLRFEYGTGSAYGTVFPMLDVKGQSYYTFIPRTNGRCSFYFKQMLKQPVFNKKEDFEKLIQKLDSIEGIEFSDNFQEKYPSFDLSVLENENNIKKLFSALDWMIEEIKILVINE